MGKFIEHIPRFIQVSEKPLEIDFNDLNELLEKINYKKSNDENWCYDQMPNGDYLLMTNNKDNTSWWIVGKIYNYDLSKYLPKLVTNYKEISDD